MSDDKLSTPHHGFVPDGAHLSANALDARNWTTMAWRCACGELIATGVAGHEHCEEAAPSEEWFTPAEESLGLRLSEYLSVATTERVLNDIRLHQAARGAEQEPTEELTPEKFVDMAAAWMRDNRALTLTDHQKAAVSHFARALDAELISGAAPATEEPEVEIVYSAELDRNSRPIVKSSPSGASGTEEGKFVAWKNPEVKRALLALARAEGDWAVSEAGVERARTSNLVTDATDALCAAIARAASAPAGEEPDWRADANFLRGLPLASGCAPDVQVTLDALADRLAALHSRSLEKSHD